MVYLTKSGIRGYGDKGNENPVRRGLFHETEPRAPSPIGVRGRVRGRGRVKVKGLFHETESRAPSPINELLSN